MENKHSSHLFLLKNFPIESWPVITALAFARSLGNSQVALLQSADSMKNQMSKNCKDYKYSDFNSILNDLGDLTLKDVEMIFEKSLDVETRKNEGVVYTPDYIIDFILSETITIHNLPTETMPILDPACGSGGFLVRAAKLLMKLKNESFSECTKYLRGLDINFAASLNAKLLLDLACIEADSKLNRAKIFQCDSLLTSTRNQLLLLDAPDGISALVTNPPYVKLQTLDKKYAQKLMKEFPDVSTGAFSLASLFLSKATSYLGKSGRAGFITLNNVFTSLSGISLRKQWLANTSVTRIIDFRHFLVFDASAYTCLIFLDNNPKSHLNFNAISQLPSLESLTNLVPSPIQYETLDPRKWRLASLDNLKLIRSMESMGNPLGEIADIRVGFATLSDKAFIGRFEGERLEFIGGDGKEREIEGASTHEFIKVSELQGEQDPIQFKRPIIYPYYREDSKRALIPLVRFAQDFPMAFEHLQSWEHILASRKLSDFEQWHQWGRRQSLVSDGPKLLTKTFDAQPRFRLDHTNSLFCNGYSIKPKQVMESYSIEILKAFLESRFMFAYALVTSFEIAGGYQCYQKNFIEKICIPPMTYFRNIENDTTAIEIMLGKFYGIELSLLDACLNHYAV